MSEPSDNLHPLEDEILECLETDDVELALTRLCARYPEHADQIRRIAVRLRSLGAFSSVDDHSEIRRLGPFELRERLGEGGMGVVYRAWQHPPGREVALKVIRPELLHFGGTRARFDREIEASVKLSHPGIVPVYEVGSTDGVPWFSMAFVRGKSLAAVIAELAARDPASLSGADLKEVLRSEIEAGEKPASHSTSAAAFLGDWVEACVHVVHAVAAALAHAHMRGVLHRDVKPSNIMLSVGGHPMLLDFGLAHTQDSQRITHSQGALGSLPYMPPEMLHGHVVTPHPGLDVYALGVTLYELLSLRNPFIGATPEITRRNILDASPEPLRRRNPRVTKDLATVCATAMADEPLRRYQTMADFANDLANVRDGVAIRAAPDSLFERSARFVRRNRLLVATTMTIFIVLVAGVATSLAMYFESERQRGMSDRQRRRAEWATYRASIVAAEQALRSHSAAVAIEALLTGKHELRAWEWRHALARIDLSTGVVLRRDGPLRKIAVGERYIVVAGERSVVVLQRDSCELVREYPATGVVGVASAGPRVVWADRRSLYATHPGASTVRVFGAGAWTAIAVDPSGSKLASVGEDGVVAVWRLSDLSLLAHSRVAGDDRLRAVSLSDYRLACGGEGHVVHVIAHDLASERVELGKHHGIVDGLAFHPSGKVLAAISRDRAVSLWSVVSGEQIGFALQHEEEVRSVSFDPLGKREMFTAAGAAIYSWNPETGTRRGGLHGQLGPVLDLAWQAPHGPLLSVSSDGTLRRWDPNVEDQRLPTNRRAVAGLAVFPGGKRVATISATEAARVHNVEDSTVAFDGATSGVGIGRGVFVSRDGQELGWIGEDKIVVVDAEDWSVRATLDELGVIRAVFSPDGRWIAAAVRARPVIRLLSLAGSEKGRELAVAAPIEALAYTNDGKRLAVAGAGLGVRVIDVTTGDEVACLTKDPHRCVALDPRSSRVAAGGPDGARVWRLDSFQEVVRMPGPVVHDLTFDREGDRVLTGGEDGVLRVFTDRGVEVTRYGPLGAAIRELELDASGTMLVTVDELGQLLLWPSVAVEDVERRLAELQPRSAPTATTPPAAIEWVEPEVCVEGEVLSSEPSGGRIKIQDHGRWSGGRQVWWFGGKKGDTLAFDLPMLRAGRYSLTARLTRSFDYASIRMSFNGEPISKPLEMQSAKITIVDVDLGEVTARQGANQITFEIAATPAALQQSRFANGAGIDRLVFKKLD